MAAKMLDAETFRTMVKAGTRSLKEHVKEVNDLNVFPIPDGDTGDNMLLTMMGAANAEVRPDLSGMTRNIADGMLLSARGNSGVILSQFFNGIAEGFAGMDEADTETIKAAFRSGVRRAYGAVMEPAEGTILTVANDAAEYACETAADGPSDYVRNFIDEARRSLVRTPDLLPVLKKAGVVDSGGAGLIYIIEGMLAALNGDEKASGALEEHIAEGPKQLDLSRFDENSELEFGYCTELLLRLQTKKTDPETFDIEVIKDYLKTIGNSVVIFKTGSIVKLHVHTMTPQLVLGFCQQFGEFLTVKIENMSLQHNNHYDEEKKEEEPALSELFHVDREENPHKAYGIVAAAAGEGIQEELKRLGADAVVDGGQSMNPSSEAFLTAFRTVNADTIFVLPNNGNVVLAARQAAELYKDAEVRVIESHTIGGGFAALSMFSPETDNADEIEEEMKEAMEDVVTASVSRCVRSTDFDGMALHEGEYIGFVGKDILAASDSRQETLLRLSEQLDFEDHEICILIFGKEAAREEAEALGEEIEKQHPGTEVFLIDGKQDVYDYIMIAE